MSAMTYTQSVTMVALTCCRDGCGMTFGVPMWWEHTRRENHTTWYCPNGHGQHFPGQSDIEKARDEAARCEQSLRGARAANERLRMERDAEARRGAAARGQVTKIRNRIAKGVCPHCNRSFPDVAAHMASKHAEAPS